MSAYRQPKFPARSQDVKHKAGRWWTMILSLFIGLVGVVLTAGGVWLISLGGSWYYGITGLGLILTATLLIAGRMAGFWSYFVVWIGTWVWAIWEVGIDFWPLVPRVAAPTLVLALLALCIPYLRWVDNRQHHPGVIFAAVLLAFGAAMFAHTADAQTPASQWAAEQSEPTAKPFHSLTAIADPGRHQRHGHAGSVLVSSPILQCEFSSGILRTHGRSWDAQRVVISPGGHHFMETKIGDPVIACTLADIS